jgi:type IV pilus assembly protein PilB
MKTRIGELLIMHDIISEQQLNEALVLQKKTNRRLGEILIELGHLTIKDLLWMLSEQADIPFVEIEPEMCDMNLINSFPETLLYDNDVLPLYESEDKIFVAVGDPANERAIMEIRKFTKKKVVLSGADPEKIAKLLNRVFLSDHLDRSIKSLSTGRGVIEITTSNAQIIITDKSGKKMEKCGNINITVDIAPVGKNES